MDIINAPRAQDLGAARPPFDDYVSALPGLDPRRHPIIALHVFGVGLALKTSPTSRHSHDHKL